MQYTPELARAYSNKREGFDETGNKILEVLKETQVEGSEVLDFGAGDGRFSAEIKKMGAKRVIGIDRSETMAKLATEKHADDSVSFVTADGDHLPFKDEQFDRVFSNFVIHYFGDEFKTFSEISRVLKSGGYFVGTFNISEVEPEAEHLFNTSMPIRLGQGEGSVIVQNLIKSEEGSRAAMEEAGFTILSYTEIGHPNAVIDDSYEDKDKVEKKVILCVARKN